MCAYGHRVAQDVVVPTLAVVGGSRDVVIPSRTLVGGSRDVVIPSRTLVGGSRYAVIPSRASSAAVAARATVPAGWRYHPGSAWLVTRSRTLSTVNMPPMSM